MAKISARKLILCQLLCLHFKHKNNNIKRKTFWVQEIFMERHSKGEFHVLFKDMKLFHYEYFFKHIAQHLTVIFFFFYYYYFFNFFNFFIFKLGFTPCKAEQPQQSMGLQEKETQKG